MTAVGPGLAEPAETARCCRRCPATDAARFSRRCQIQAGLLRGLQAGNIAFQAAMLCLAPLSLQARAGSAPPLLAVVSQAAR